MDNIAFAFEYLKDICSEVSKEHPELESDLRESIERITRVLKVLPVIPLPNELSEINRKRFYLSLLRTVGKLEKYFNSNYQTDKALYKEMESMLNTVTKFITRFKGSSSELLRIESVDRFINQVKVEESHLRQSLNDAKRNSKLSNIERISDMKTMGNEMSTAIELREYISGHGIFNQTFNKLPNLKPSEHIPKWKKLVCFEVLLLFREYNLPLNDIGSLEQLLNSLFQDELDGEYPDHDDRYLGYDFISNLVRLVKKHQTFQLNSEYSF